MSLHYYSQLDFSEEENKKEERLMKDVFYGIKPYLTFIHKVKNKLENEEISFNVSLLEQAPHYEILLRELDEADDVDERKTIEKKLMDSGMR